MDGILQVMASVQLPDMSRLAAATAHLELPFAVVDEVALAHNTADLVRRAAGKPLRLTTKSVRVRGLVERSAATDGFAGVMTYSLAESIWLADHGVDDILLAYPTADRSALGDLVATDHRAAAITVMVDSVDGVDLIESAVGRGRPPVRVCIDVDASLRIGRLHIGVRRSPLRTAEQAAALARTIATRPGLALAGLMFYDAQIAGLPDGARLIRQVKARSATELLGRRHAVVEAVEAVAPVEIVNGGGTGSLVVTGADPVVTELTAGSGLFCPTSFDGYRTFDPHAAALFALPVVRKPAEDIATLYGGGYPASGPEPAAHADVAAGPAPDPDRGCGGGPDTRPRRGSPPARRRRPCLDAPHQGR